jgi:hypothetical protein
MEQRHGRHAQLLYPEAWAFVGAGPGGLLEGVDGCGRHLRAAVDSGVGSGVDSTALVGNDSGGEG